MRVLTKKISVCFVIHLITICVGFAQVTNTGVMDTVGGERIKNLVVGGYIDSYYGYNFSEPKSGNNPYFVSMNRHNEMTINLAYLDIRYSSDRIRGRFVPGFGSYINANYSAESGSLKNIVEASIGYKLSTNKDIWMDAGVLGSPYTNESAISRDHLMYTRSFAPEYVPYYLSGIKLSVPLQKKINAYLYLLNGWQQIQDQNSQKSIGTQIEFRPNNKNLFNWNTYLGDERSVFVPTYRMRYFTDVFWIYNPDGKLSITSCAYVGMQQKIDSTNVTTNSIWWQLNAVARYKFSDQISLSGRVEYFSDPNSVQIVPVTTTQGFESFSGGLCMNIKLSENLLFRFEGRHFMSGNNVYLDKQGNPSNNSTWIISNLTVWF